MSKVHKPQALTFAKIATAEQETVIRKSRRTKTATITSCWATDCRQLLKKYGTPKQIRRNADGLVTSCSWEVPVKLVSYHKPRAMPKNARQPGTRSGKARRIPRIGSKSREISRKTAPIGS